MYHIWLKYGLGNQPINVYIAANWLILCERIQPNIGNKYMLTTLNIEENKKFIGRTFEWKRLQQIAEGKESAIIIVYGRRRVGKTELLQQVFRNRNVIKFEGLEGKSEKKQIKHVLYEISRSLQDMLIAKLNLSTWVEVFELIGKYIAKGKWTLYFEEVQWLAAYKHNLIAELKYVWDNAFRYNPQLILILCGSSPSFMINKVVHSKALYNRSQHQIALQEFNLIEVRDFLGKKTRSLREIMDAYLAIGGIPEYLKYIKTESSIHLGICKNAFIKDSFFTHEYEKVFTSSLAQNVHYQQILNLLSQKRFMTRNEIADRIKVSSGGTLTKLLFDLEQCGFIDRYTPYNLSEKSLIARYAINDQYLQFYFKFIHPLKKRIDSGEFNSNPVKALNIQSYSKWLGFAFERACRKYCHLFAKILGFAGVSYKAGAFFKRPKDGVPEGYQLDLVYERADKVSTICEIKYTSAPVRVNEVQDFESKLMHFPNREKCSIQKVLISASGAEKKIKEGMYFDRIITLEDMFMEHYWS